MKRRHPVRTFNRFAERLSRTVTKWAGGTVAFMAALLLIVGWLVLGPIFHYSDTWQLVINTATTIVTFLMVFLIQRAQNKDATATSLKLNELVASIEGASNRLVDVEDLARRRPHDASRPLPPASSTCRRRTPRSCNRTRSRRPRRATK